MYAQVEKPKENKNRTVSDSVAQKQGFGFVDNRPEAVVQRKLQKIVNNNSRVWQESNYGLVNNSLESELQPIQRVSVNTPDGTVETDELNGKALAELCSKLEKLAHSSKIKNQWEAQYHKAASELLKRSLHSNDDFEMDMDEVKEKEAPESFSYSGKTYNKKETSSGIYYEPDDFIKSSGSYVTIHDLASGNFYTHSHASRKKRCSAIWIGKKLAEIKYNDGETEMTDENDKSIHSKIARELGYEFLKYC